MVSRTKSTGRAGFTLIELGIVLTLFTLMAWQCFVVLRSGERYSSADMATAVVEQNARMVLDRVVYSLMGAHRESIEPAADTPLHTTEIRFQGTVGLEDGKVIWTDPESIGLDDPQNAVIWKQNPGLPEERRMVWSRIVRPFLEGELQNGLDDNGNGLVDERGLHFVVDGNTITVTICLERELDNGDFATRSVTSTVTVRNLLEQE